MNATVDSAAHAAAHAFRDYARATPAQRAQLLREIADGIERLGDALVTCVNRETALPAARITGERARTCMQLRLFADLAERDAWIDARLDPADAQRTPPKPQVRSRLRPLGPVAVFAASNFPLAFSVAGGDTAAALAVGCPVIVKAHPAHPDTAALVAEVIHAAVRKYALPPGVFSLVADSSREASVALVRHPAIMAGAFTGSLQGGMALWRAAQQRDEPIPFFAEMGSTNPVFLFPRALAHDAAGIAAGLHASMTLGVGQFCTQPGLIFLVDDAASRTFLDQLAVQVDASAPGAMLSPLICANYRHAVGALTLVPGVRTLARVDVAGHSADADDRLGGAALFATDADTFCAQRDLCEEVFGPASLAVLCKSPDDFARCAAKLPGQLTASIWSGGEPLGDDSDLLWTLEQKVGRIVFDGFPTGVEVGTAMMHGGPFPATTDSRFTSVGTRAIQRFVRPVAWQTPGNS
ncbi:MAG: aldehyde dehydrogenase (NADP(+)) [Gammaproteobacteria bacterium]|nr:MAG: aldehyde dehydrogenase (NADP(+)) [Gammaproteobacteria bacterium]